MNHLDEGTIHAWLDGALDAEQSRAAEAHIQACRACADAVAEARGLVAASSRILGALDDVPAKVIPAAPARKRRSLWRAAPWVTGIAAALVGVIVLRDADVSRKSEFGAANPSTPVVDTARALAATSSQDAPATAPSAAPASRSQVAQAPSARPPVARSTRGAVSGSAGGGASVGSAAVVSQPSEALVTASPEQRVGEDARKAQIAEEVSINRQRSAREDVVERGRVAERSAEAAAPAPPPIAGLAPQRSVLTDMRAVRPIDPLRDTLSAHARLAGCYVVSVGMRTGIAQEFARQGAAADARRSAPVASAAVAQKTGINRVTIRLDSVPGPRGYPVRDARADTSIGWWSRVAGDSARVELQMLGVVAGLSARDRVNCPER